MPELCRQRPPLPPFTEESARQKVRLAEDDWNSRNVDRVALAYSVGTRWRNRHELLRGRDEVAAFLTKKWRQEHEYRLVKELWAWGDERIAVRFAYEWHDGHGQWFRSYGNENWVLNADGLITERYASINDLPIAEQDRLFRWLRGPRPEDYPGLSALGL